MTGERGRELAARFRIGALVHVLQAVTRAFPAVVLAVLTFRSIPAWSETEDTSFQLVSQAGGVPSSTALTRIESTVYLGVGPRLTAIDVSDPAAPRLSGSSAPLSGLVERIAASGHEVYATTTPGGLQTVDVSDPTKPRPGTTLPIDGAQGVVVSGGYAYVTADAILDNRLLVIDISNPAALAEVGRYTLDPEVAAGDLFFKWRLLAMDGSYVYVASGGSGVRVIDVSDPSRPTVAQTIAARGQITGVAVGGGRLYISDAQAKVGGPRGSTFGANQLRVFDVTDPLQAVEIAAQPLSAAPGPLVLDGTRLYVGTPTGVRIVSVANPSQPIDLGEAPGGGGFDVSGSRLFRASGGLRVTDVSSPAAPRDTGTYPITGSRVDRIAVADGYVSALQVGDKATNVPEGLVTFDATDSSHIVQDGFLALPFLFRADLAVANGLAYIPNQDDHTPGREALRIVDLMDPLHPVSLASVDAHPGGYGPAIAVAGGYAYVAVAYAAPQPRGGLRVLDVRDPKHMVEVDALPAPIKAQHILVGVGRAYVAAGSEGLFVFDTSNPARPVQLAQVSSSGLGYHDFVAVAVSGAQVYVADRGRGLSNFDVSDPTAPVEGDPEPYSSPDLTERLAVGGTLLAVVGSFGLRALDVSDPAHLVEVAGLSLPAATDVALVGCDMYVAAGSAGLYVIRLTDSAGANIRC